MSTLLRGAPVAERLTLDLSRRSAALRHRGVIPTLAILRVGSSPGDLAYEKSAAARCARCGIEVRRLFWDSAAPLAEAIRAVNADPSIHGCLLLRPLADRAAEAAAGQLLLPDKDVDGMTPGSLAGLLTGQSGFAPCTAQACLELLDYYEVPLAGRRAVVVGRSLVVGKPVSMMLLRRNASVTICHSKTEHLEDICREADIVICATGRARAFGAAYFSPGQTVLDVGINFDTQGKLCGDVDFEAVEPVVGAITPVPGGIGSVTTSVTMAHTVEAAERAAAHRGLLGTAACGNGR